LVAAVSRRGEEKDEVTQKAFVLLPGRDFKILFEIAADNYGFVTVDEARRAGIRPQRLAEMAARGALRREGFGLYRLEPFPEQELDPYRKATLWPHGVEGVVSHETALDLHGLSDVNPAKIHVTLPRQSVSATRRTCAATYCDRRSRTRSGRGL
jgi:predicted transcriptional regulator of viral defense system